MKWFARGRSKGEVERELRRARPEPPASLVQAIVGRTGARRSKLEHRRARVGVAVAVLVVTAAAVGATGGFSAAATSIFSAAGSISHTGATHVQVTPLRPQPASFVSSSPRHFDSACDMYAQAPTISDDDLGVAAPGETVAVDGTNFTGINEVTNVEVGGTQASFHVDSSESLEFIVPDGASGNTTVTVSNCAGTSNSVSLTVESAPSITTVSPGTAGWGAQVTITGTGFLGTTKVDFNGKEDPNFTVEGGGTQITAHVPSGAPTHAGYVEVVNGVNSVKADFTVEGGAPTVTRLLPASGQVGQDGSIRIFGTHFADSSGSLVTHVYFSGTDGPVEETFAPVSATEVDANSVPTGAITGPITVVTSVGAATSKQDFTVVAPTPVVDEISPSFGKVRSTIKLEGSSLTGVTGVMFTGADGTTQTEAGTNVRVIDDSTVSVKVPVTANTGPVEVSRDNGQSGTSSVPFTVISDKPSFTVSPGSGGYGTTVTLTADADTTLTGVTAVAFNGKKDPGFSVSGDGATVTATVQPHTPVRPTGRGVVSVTNAAGTTSMAFDVISFGPTISKVFGTLGDGNEAEVGDPIVITGTNLDTVTSVEFGGRKTATSFVWQDPGLLAVQVPAGATSGTITVVNPDGQATSSTSLTILHQPSVVTFSPAFGRSGTSVKIVGDGFSGVSAVYFGGAPAKFKYVDDNTITATVPSNASTGSVEVVVGRVMSADSGNDVFTVVATKPTVSDYSPLSGNAGTDVTVTGRQFVGPLTVKFGGKEASFVHVTSSTQLTARIPDGASGTVSVSVTNLAGTAMKSGFKVVSLRHTSPATGVRSRTRITLTGTNLTAGGTPTVKVGGTAATVVSASPSRVVATVPATASSGAITLTTGSIAVKSATTFTVIVAPSIRSYPASGRLGAWVDIYGSGFTGVTSVKFGSTAARFTIVSDGHLQARVSRTGSVRVTIRNAAGTATTVGSFSGTRH